MVIFTMYCSFPQSFRIPSRATVWLCGLLLLMLPAVFVPASQPRASMTRDVRIGVLAYRDQWTTLARWQPTAEYLNGTVAGHRFQIVTYDHTGLHNALNAGKLDFILTNTGHFLELKQSFGVVPVATLVNRHEDRPLTRFGAAVFARADRDDIVAFADLQGLRFVATGREAFGGFQMAWYELRKYGLDPFADFDVLQLTGLPQDQVVLTVRDRLADAGTVRTGVLERMAQEGKIDLNEFKIIGSRSDDSFPYLHSTPLYPEWPLARTSRTTPELAKAVAEALYALEPHSEPAVGARISGWTVPLDYGAAEAVLRELEVAPFVDPVDSRGRLGRFALWLMALLLLPVLVWAWYAARGRGSVDRGPDRYGS